MVPNIVILFLSILNLFDFNVCNIYLKDFLYQVIRSWTFWKYLAFCTFLKLFYQKISQHNEIKWDIFYQGGSTVIKIKYYFADLTKN